MEENGIPPLTESDDERISRQLSIRLANAPRIKVFVYRCTNPKCNAIDRVKFFDHEPHPPYCGQMINCWKCHNGRKCKTIDEMIASKRGMAIIRVETLTGEPIQEGDVH